MASVGKVAYKSHLSAKMAHQVKKAAETVTNHENNII